MRVVSVHPQIVSHVMRAEFTSGLKAKEPIFSLWKRLTVQGSELNNLMCNRKRCDTRVVLEGLLHKYVKYDCLGELSPE